LTKKNKRNAKNTKIFLKRKGNKNSKEGKKEPFEEKGW
jgi:hypothetical protein